MTALASQGAFEETGFTATLLEARTSLEDFALQMNQMLFLSFDVRFSFSLASVIFKILRRPQFKASAANVLRYLLTNAVSTLPVPADEATVLNEALGYVVALLPVSTTLQSYQRLLQEVCVGSNWLPKKEQFNHAELDRDQVPHVPFELSGCQ